MWPLPLRKNFHGICTLIFHELQARAGKAGGQLEWSPALTPALSPRRGRNFGCFRAGARRGIGRMRIQKRDAGVADPPLLGERAGVRAGPFLIAFPNR